MAALATLATADGADLDDWLVKAARAIGATRMGVQVSRDPTYRIVRDSVVEAGEVYEQAMVRALAEIRDILEGAGDQADKNHYRKRLE